MKLPKAESYKIKMVEAIRLSTMDERVTWIKKANYNLFNLKSDHVFIDLLTDSGTGAMSDKQWSEMMLGDESYAGASSYYKLKNAIQDITGFEYFLPTHQGRAAENVLFSTLIKKGDIIPGNSHFDTTKAHIEHRKSYAVDCTINEAFDTEVNHPFKGNIDIVKLEKVLTENPVEKIPLIIVTITCNSSGGQPVSMQNMKKVSKVAKKYGIPVYYDSARFAENAYFIKKREKGYSDKSIREIVKEMFSYADGMTMSSKKDAIVNMGGFLGLRQKEIFDRASVFNILYEGFNTYGGMSGRDMNALAQGLYEGTEFSYLETRINQVAFLGQMLKDKGIPVQFPFGGHAIFVDAKKFLPHLPKEEFVAQTLAVELYIEGGVRAVEIGSIMADRDPDSGLNRYPDLELMRLAIPRRTYTNDHMKYIAAAIINVFERRDKITKGLKIVKEAPILRHFTVELDRA
ncbi:MAG: tryptophanase [Lentimicrobiaceae bacterium]|jgi:tryptophanase|nr:tryptophanase [Lentimicrobiaceae bacterium]MCP4911342.1 tryptophanase [Bacteroidota bacterium]MBT3454072.1 tryptophanase [Lentimicrobiaceae bacterium]MBT3819190.1 tryptophanase [Lentimicrobiaceae bacterium]MBT4060619.1 tryptophanase [Lentimicrobiaceae bacterium]